MKKFFFLVSILLFFLSLVFFGKIILDEIGKAWELNPCIIPFFVILYAFLSTIETFLFIIVLILLEMKRNA